ncbi:MAG: DNA replication/repair protein RecF [Streptococcaceae bacterium]|jgi:DNA replication and repair protein RecF|nr:DNA replication/repair protein RecF [Streptococcaceae bacterium]
MILSDLHLQNVRNYMHLDLELHPQLNLFVGPNAQGKTNILEAIYFLATTRSHRTRTEKELIQWGEKSLTITGNVQKSTTTVPLELSLDAKGRHVKVNHLPENRLADYIGQLKAILFAPENLELVKGAPAVRRRFLDMEIGQTHPTYIYDLLRYNHTLHERNALLKNEQDSIDPVLLDVLDTQLLEHGTKIIATRKAFLAQLSELATAIHKELTHDSETLNLNYLPRVESDFAQELKDRRKVDLIRHQTTIGPHRDDFSFISNTINLADFGSQGQQRTAALSIKLAEIELIHKESGEYPILLLDDVLSELDNTRQLDLLATALNKTQTFLTTTTLEHLKNLPKALQIYNVASGSLTLA